MENYKSFRWYTYCAGCGERIYFNHDGDAPKYCECCEAKQHELKDTTD